MIRSRLFSSKEILSLILFNLLIANLSYGQLEFTIGKVEESDFVAPDNDICVGQSVICLFNDVEISFAFPDTKMGTRAGGNTGRGFVVDYTYKQRFLIVNQDGLSAGDVSIFLNKSPFFGDKLTNIKAYTFNLINGKIEKEKLSSKSIYTENYGDYGSFEKFLMPAVQVGSILDIEYSIRSEYIFELKTIPIQEEFPVLNTRITTKIPEYFDYRLSTNGTYEVDRNLENERGVIKLTFVQEAEGISTERRVYENEINFRVDVNTYSINNIPAWKEVPLLFSDRDYRFSMKHTLISTNFPNRNMSTPQATWKDIDDIFYKYVIKDLYSERKLLKSKAKEFEVLNEDSLSLLKSLFSYVKDNYEIEDKGSYISKFKSIEESIETLSGNSFEVNSILFLLLKHSGFKVFPVLTSFRDEGQINKFNAELFAFNTMIVGVNYGEEVLLLDASNKYNCIDLPSREHMNSIGRFYMEDYADWFSLGTGQPDNISSILTINLGKGGECSLQGRLKMYSAIKFLDGGRDLYIQQFTESISKSGFFVDSIDFKVKSESEVDFDIKMKSSVDFQNQSAVFSILIPNLFEDFQVSSFDSPRLFPIEFEGPYSYQQTTTINIPTGFSLKSLPENYNILSQDKTMYFSQQFDNSNGVINVTYILKRNSVIYSNEAVSMIQSFYNEVNERINQRIILNK